MNIIQSTCTKLEDDISLVELKPYTLPDRPSVGDFVSNVFNLFKQVPDLENRIRLRLKIK